MFKYAQVDSDWSLEQYNNRRTKQIFREGWKGYYPHALFWVVMGGTEN